MIFYEEKRVFWGILWGFLDVFRFPVARGRFGSQKAPKSAPWVPTRRNSSGKNMIGKILENGQKSKIFNFPKMIFYEEIRVFWGILWGFLDVFQSGPSVLAAVLRILQQKSPGSAQICPKITEKWAQKAKK